jgi:hypothetical protein
MVNAPWYIRNNDLHIDLQVDAVSTEIQRFAQKQEGRPPASWERWCHTAPGQHGRSVQSPEEKTVSAGLSDSVKAETVLVQVLV